MNIIIKLAPKFLFAVIFLAAVIFLSSGSFNFWQGWIFSGIFFLYVTAILFLPQKLLERRMRQEKEQKQKFITMYFGFLFVLNFIICGLNYRFNWQKIQTNIDILGCAMVFLGYLIMFISLKENEYAAKNVAVEDGQKVFSEGFYAVIRHPMYLGNMITIIFIPLALGFYWSLGVSLLLVILLILRIINEEKVLISGLNGYVDYCHNIKWRLIPYIW